jgi:hypothetical protein
LSKAVHAAWTLLQMVTSEQGVSPACVVDPGIYSDSSNSMVNASPVVCRPTSCLNASADELANTLTREPHIRITDSTDMVDIGVIFAVRLLLRLVTLAPIEIDLREVGCKIDQFVTVLQQGE